MFDKENTLELFGISKIAADEIYAEEFSSQLNSFSKTLPLLDEITPDEISKKKEAVDISTLRKDEVLVFENADKLFDNSNNKMDNGIAIDKIID